MKTNQETLLKEIVKIVKSADRLDEIKASASEGAKGFIEEAEKKIEGALSLLRDAYLFEKIGSGAKREYVFLNARGERTENIEEAARIAVEVGDKEAYRKLSQKERKLVMVQVSEDLCKIGEMNGRTWIFDLRENAFKEIFGIE